MEGCEQQHCEKHETCWNRHLAVSSVWANSANAHKQVKREMQLFSRVVMHSEVGERLRQLHERDRAARWFNIRHDGGNPTLYVHNRFGKLCDPSRSGNIATVNQYPSFVSFIGKSGVGKSTLVRAMMLLGAINESRLLSSTGNAFGPDDLEAFAKSMSSPREIPVTKSGDLNHLTDPTTFGVHLYKDEYHSSGMAKFPTLFADCEGFYTGKALSNAERFAEQQSDSSQTLAKHLLYKAEITSPTYRTQDKRGIDLFYARFLYAISDVVVYVTNDDSLIESSITSILEWAAAAVHNSINHPSRKTLIIVRHMANSHDPKLYDDDFLQRSYIKEDVKVWKGSKVLDDFVAEYNSKQEMTECIYENRDLYKILFSEILCCYIPNKNHVGIQPDELFHRYQHLREKIDAASQQAQSLRQKSWTQYNVPTLSSILLKAFEHFRVSDRAFDFYMAARNDNPTPGGISEHLANFLRLVLETSTDSSMKLKMTKHYIALSFVIWALRHLNHCKPSFKLDWGKNN